MREEKEALTPALVSALDAVAWAGIRRGVWLRRLSLIGNVVPLHLSVSIYVRPHVLAATDSQRR